MGEITEGHPGVRPSSLGPRLALWGTYLYAATATVSIVAYQVGWVLALVGLLIGFATGRIRYRSTPLDLPWLLFVIVTLLAVPFSIDPARSLRALRGEWILLFFPVFAQALPDARAIRRAWSILIGSSTLVAIYAIWQTFAGRDLLRDRPLEPIGSLFIATGLFGHHLTYGGSILITATLALFCIPAARRRRRDRVLHVAAAGLQLAAVGASFARTAWAGLLAAIGIGAIVVRGRIRIALLAAAAAIVLAALAVPSVRHRIVAIGDFRDDPRVRLWHSSIEIWKARPVLGSGLASFRAQFERHRVPGEYLSTAHPHNDLLNVMVNTGAAGLLAFLFLWARFFSITIRARGALPDGDGRRSLLTAGMLAVGAVLIAGLGQCFLTDEEVGTLFWFLAASTIRLAMDARGEERAAA